jgi:hypothetical protein
MRVAPASGVYFHAELDDLAILDGRDDQKCTELITDRRTGSRSKTFEFGMGWRTANMLLPAAP